MRELVQKVIDGKLYEFEQFKTTKSLKVLAQLTKIFGEPLTLALGAFFKKKPEENFVGRLDENGLPIRVESVKESAKEAAREAATKAKKGLLDQDIDEATADVLAKAVRVLIERLDEDEIVDIVKTLVASKCDGQPIVFDEHFIGVPMHLFKVVGAALEVQFGNFIDAITEIAPVRRRTASGIKSV